MPLRMSAPPPVVELLDVSKSYAEGETLREVISGVKLTLHAGEFTVLLGRSGSGKSTLLNLISGIDLPSQGTVRVAGRELGALSEHARTLLRREHVGFIFQAFNLLPTLTVEENILLPLELTGRETTASHERVRALLDTVGLGNRAASFPDRLSGGEQQRVAVARALAHAPPLLLADEPTGNLDEADGRARCSTSWRTSRGASRCARSSSPMIRGSCRGRDRRAAAGGGPARRGEGAHEPPVAGARQRATPGQPPVAHRAVAAGHRAGRGGGGVHRPGQRERPARLRALHGHGDGPGDASARRRARGAAGVGVPRGAPAARGPRVRARGGGSGARAEWRSAAPHRARRGPAGRGALPRLRASGWRHGPGHAAHRARRHPHHRGDGAGAGSGQGRRAGGGRGGRDEAAARDGPAAGGGRGPRPGTRGPRAHRSLHRAGAARPGGAAVPHRPPVARGRGGGGVALAPAPAAARGRAR